MKPPGATDTRDGRGAPSTTATAAQDPDNSVGGHRRSRLPAALVLLRPRQWVKNVFVLIAPLAVDPAALLRHPGRLLATLVAFTAASAAVYVLNDWLDRERDRLHPVKRHRPLASRRVGPLGALLLGAACTGVLAGAGALLPPAGQAAIAGYVVINLAYCLALKHYPLVDVSLVATGFVLRAVAGCVAVAAPFNPALIISVYCTCLLLSLGKRRHELATAQLRGQAAAQRPALAGYSVPLLDQLMAVLLAATLISYELFALSAPHPHAAVLAVVTLPFAVFAACRYLQLVAVRRGGGEPGQDVFRDLPLVINAVLWLTCLALGRLL
ncbi:UbiA prenyltransferase family protein [Streptomyces sp. NBC_01498]|uniref:UbiA prenyltransferase family protein n=1 Tax=Streptomyces sp. NBC_01498 TaxID=2975870 RepID=UPI002E7BE45A|nr:UbiA prenyltransferase family protein [Streptomyces sp. NBC_01498]WTL23453.1 UbiA prenyltransferase family protein [Streptomyces sp. NBC_01498]